MRMDLDMTMDRNMATMDLTIALCPPRSLVLHLITQDMVLDLIMDLTMDLDLL